MYRDACRCDSRRARLDASAKGNTGIDSAPGPAMFAKDRKLRLPDAAMARIELDEAIEWIRVGRHDRGRTIVGVDVTRPSGRARQRRCRLPVSDDGCRHLDIYVA